MWINKREYWKTTHDSYPCPFRSINLMSDYSTEYRCKVLSDIGVPSKLKPATCMDCELRTRADKLVEAMRKPKLFTLQGGIP